MHQQALNYSERAQFHKPTDEAALRRESLNLAQRGLTERDIGALLQLNPAEVRRLIAADPDEAAVIHISTQMRD